MTGLPVILGFVAQSMAAECDGGVGTSDSPKHTRALQVIADHGFTGGFDDARTREDVSASKGGIAHALRVEGKTVSLPSKFSV